MLLRYIWPGNVRELRTALEHAVVLARSEKIAPRDLPASVRSGGAAAPGAELQKLLTRGDVTLGEAEKELIVQALKDAGGNRTMAAKKLGMSRRTLHRKLHEHHLEGF